MWSKGWQERACKTHYQVAPPLAVSGRVDNSTEQEVERWENYERVRQTDEEGGGRKGDWETTHLKVC